MTLRSLYPPRKRLHLKLIFFTALLLVLTAGSSFPFIWVSETLWYKFGIDKTFLLTGKVCGICAATLVFLQIILASRQFLLDRIFGLDRVFSLHRLNGFVIVSFAVLHVSLVLIPEGLDNLPIGWKFWPQMLGAATLVFIAMLVLTGTWRKKLFPYHLWRRIHRPMGYLVVLGIGIHIYFVSGTFKPAFPRYTLYSLGAVLFILVITRKILYYKQIHHNLEISSIKEVSADVVSLLVKPPPSFSHAPGQFVFIQMHGDTIASEPHPFTIASSPAESAHLQFFIKKCGDWTSKIKAGVATTLAIDGPYGLFSYSAHQKCSTVIMIAGGIGITPMLSMLRQMAAEGSQPEVILLWSLSFYDELFLQEELERLQKQLPSFEIKLIFSREENGRRIDRDLLQQQFSAFTKNGHFYICGPEKMMNEIRKALLSIGVIRKHIFWERFAL